MYLQKVISKKIWKRKLIFVAILKDTNEKNRIRIQIFIRNPMYGSKDRIHKKNVTYLEHRKVKWFLSVFVSMRDPAFIAIVHPAISSWGSGSV
jgi:hypothetical protein